LLIDVRDAHVARIAPGSMYTSRSAEGSAVMASSTTEVTMPKLHRTIFDSTPGYRRRVNDFLTFPKHSGSNAVRKAKKVWNTIKIHR